MNDDYLFEARSFDKVVFSISKSGLITYQTDEGTKTVKTGKELLRQLKIVMGGWLKDYEKRKKLSPSKKQVKQ